MKTTATALLLIALTVSACNKKTAPTTTTPAPKPTTTAEKKPATIEDLKGQKIETKQLPDDQKQLAHAKAGAVENSYKTYYENGYAKHNSGDFPGAISDFSKSIELNPQYGDAYSFRGMSKYKSGDKAGACSDWQRAAELGNSTAMEMVVKNCK